MNTSKLADIAEITSSIAILMTLVFLVVQMQQNTEAVQSNSRQAILSEELQYIFKQLDNPSLTGNRYKPQLTDDEKIQLHFSYIAFFRMREIQWLQFQNGVLDGTTWEAYRKTIGVILSSDRGRTWWQRSGEVQFDLNFVTHVDDYLADLPVTNINTALAAID
jgi:hypothetical protein